MSIFHADIITLFPEMFPGALQYSIAGNALRNGIWSYSAINLRCYGLGKHKKVDDTQYGGGAGLVMRADVLGVAIDEALKKSPDAMVCYPSAHGKRLTQADIIECSLKRNIIFVSGRFEGVDERVIEYYNPFLFSVGDYILSGGEIAILALLDGIIRVLPGVLKSDTLMTESFDYHGFSFLEGPQYTKPRVWKSMHVPEVLLSGDHAKVLDWKLRKSIEVTEKLRPDLLCAASKRIDDGN